MKGIFNAEVKALTLLKECPFIVDIFTSYIDKGESLILIKTIVLRAQDLRPGAKIPKQERRPNAAMIFISQKNHLREAARNGSMSVTDHSRQ